MKILGIDPGSTTANPSGWALVDVATDTVLAHGLLKPERGENHLASLTRQMDELIGCWRMDISMLAIETAYIGQNARTGLVLAELVGAYLGVAALHRIPTRRIEPSKAKAAMCDGGADKAMMQQSARLRYGLAVPPHVADAIGIALACTPQMGEEA